MPEFDEQEPLLAREMSSNIQAPAWLAELHTILFGKIGQAYVARASGHQEAHLAALSAEAVLATILDLGEPSKAAYDAFDGLRAEKRSCPLCGVTDWGKHPCSVRGEA